ncbi:MAG: hypothetical protein B6U88_02130 [Candidatus Aenigmarchaeota archaeon ex4484_56]|nr:MAG: hypothetical protein B6U88_02130 [Candidatus Aenigmarchaeota archaeon ex4484_56]
MRGTSIAIQTIIVIVICILVLVAVILFFKFSYGPASNSTMTESKLRSECLDWQRFNFDEDSLGCSNTPPNYPILCSKVSDVPDASEKANKARSICNFYIS